MKEGEGSYETDKDKILHDMKRIALVMRELANTIDQLYADVNKMMELKK